MIHKGGRNMGKKLWTIVLIMGLVCSLTGCKNEGKTATVPPENGEEIVFQSKSVLYQNAESTSYSLSEPGVQFALSDSMLRVGDEENTWNYEITYDKTALTVENFEKQFREKEGIPDISSYKSCIQYDLCKATDTTPGYRLYVMDKEYWMGTLYQGAVWRIVSLDLENDL